MRVDHRQSPLSNPAIKRMNWIALATETVQSKVIASFHKNASH
jgi:hypothetical protein